MSISRSNLNKMRDIDSAFSLAKTKTIRPTALASESIHDIAARSQAMLDYLKYCEREEKRHFYLGQFARASD